jgi:hypothetical protein
MQLRDTPTVTDLTANKPLVNEHSQAADNGRISALQTKHRVNPLSQTFCDIKLLRSRNITNIMILFVIYYLLPLLILLLIIIIVFIRMN